jgi:membrane associated rhomboid family serine protease
MPNGLACKDSCEARVMFINKVLDANRQVMAVSNTQIRSHALLTLIMGLVFGVFAAAAGFNHLGFIAAFFGVAAAVLFSYGFFRLRGQRYPSQPNND